MAKLLPQDRHREGGTAPAYFRRIGALLATTEVTGADGESLSLDSGATRAVEHVLAVSAVGGKVILIGNGGSASIAGHMQMDLCNRAGVRALVFNDPPVLTALANDHGYASAFDRLVALWAEPSDCLIAVSSSGQSDNILRSVATARTRGCRVVTMSGFAPDNPLRRTGDVNFYVASEAYGEVEVVHHALGHFLTDRAAATPHGT